MPSQTKLKQTNSKKNKWRKLSGKRLTNLCGQLLDSEVKGIEYPGGKSRQSVRLTLADGHSVIVTQRSARRAAIENSILRDLNQGGAPVPRIIASQTQLLIQEDIIGSRLSVALHQSGGESEHEQLLNTALESLAKLHKSGSAVGLDDALAPLGASDEWLRAFLRRPLAIGKHLNIRPDRPRLDELQALLRVRRPRFVKWDARPANAIARSDGEIVWFDWEHCGSRNRLDDVAWLLTDEFVPDFPGAEGRLIDRHINNFRDDLDADEARTYLYAYGVFHMTVRLGLILDRKGSDPWWNFDACLAGDKVGVTALNAHRTCARAARWAAQSSLTEPLVPWFEQLIEKLNLKH